MGPPSRVCQREGPFFMDPCSPHPSAHEREAARHSHLVRFIFSFPLSFADRFFLFHSHPLLLAPSSRVALVVLPPRHASPPCHASPFATRCPLSRLCRIPPSLRAAPSSRAAFSLALSRRPCRAAPRHASPLLRHAFVTRRPSRVASPRRDARFGLAVCAFHARLCHAPPFRRTSCLVMQCPRRAAWSRRPRHLGRDAQKWRGGAYVE